MKNYFKKSEFKGLPAAMLPLQSFLFDNLLNILNIIRAEIGSPVVITSCARDIKKYKDMKKRGLYPSPTSDHFWGLAVPCLEEKHKRIYGEYFTLSAGAVDIVTPRASVFQSFKLIVKLSIGEMIGPGQVIYERRLEPTPAEWIHLSNPRDLIFQESFLNEIGAKKQPYLFSKDGGESYQIFKF